MDRPAVRAAETLRGIGANINGCRARRRSAGWQTAQRLRLAEVPLWRTRIGRQPRPGAPLAHRHTPE